MQADTRRNKTPNRRATGAPGAAFAPRPALAVQRPAPCLMRWRWHRRREQRPPAPSLSSISRKALPGLLKRWKTQMCVAFAELRAAMGRDADVTSLVFFVGFVVDSILHRLSFPQSATCSICLGALQEPVSLPCRHTFCSAVRSLQITSVGTQSNPHSALYAG